jgi:hypothetical protein
LGDRDAGLWVKGDLPSVFCGMGQQSEGRFCCDGTPETLRGKWVPNASALRAGGGRIGWDGNQQGLVWGYSRWMRLRRKLGTLGPKIECQ